VIHLDTSYIVDLLREKRRGATGPATRLLQGLVDEELSISACVLCELRAGAELARSPASEHESVNQIERTLTIVPVDGAASLHYGRLLAHLRQRGNSIAVMDLLIASAALVAGAALATRNVKHFERVPDLELLTY